MDDRVYVECLECSWGCSGSIDAVEDKADQHIYMKILTIE